MSEPPNTTEELPCLIPEGGSKILLPYEHPDELLHLSKKQADEVEEMGYRSYGDLYWFMTEMLGFDCLTDRAGIQGQMCREYERTRGRNSVNLWPRGHGKSTVFSIAGTIQDIIRNRDVRKMIVSASPELAGNICTAIRHILTSNETLKILFNAVLFWDPNKESPRWTESRLRVKQSPKAQQNPNPTILAVSAGQEVTGCHVDDILCDDIVNKDNIATLDLREKLITWFRLIVPFVDRPHGFIRFVGTRYLEDDLYGFVEQIWDKSVFTRRQAEEDGKSIFPLRFPPEVLADLRKTLGVYVYNCQYMNDPSRPEDAIFKREMFRYYETAEMPPDLNWYLAIDAAFGTKRENCESALLIHAMDSDRRRYFHRMIVGKWESGDLIDKILHIIHEMQSLGRKCKSIGLEQTAAKVLASWLRDRMRQSNADAAPGIRRHPVEADIPAEMLDQPFRLSCPIYEFKLTEGGSPGSGKAKLRIEQLEPGYAEGLIFHHISLKDGEFEGQLLMYPVAKRDDQADCAAMSLQQARPPTRRAPAPPKTFREHMNSQLGPNRDVGQGWSNF